MSTKHVRTAADLVRFGCSLKVECTACGAAQTLTGVEVHRLHGSASLELLRPRLKCKRRRLKVAKIAVLPPV
jgi:hypothetical protein